MRYVLKGGQNKNHRENVNFFPRNSDLLWLRKEGDTAYAPVPYRKPESRRWQGFARSLENVHPTEPNGSIFKIFCFVVFSFFVCGFGSPKNASIDPCPNSENMDLFVWKNIDGVWSCAGGIDCVLCMEMYAQDCHGNLDHLEWHRWIVCRGKLETARWQWKHPRTTASRLSTSWPSRQGSYTAVHGLGWRWQMKKKATPSFDRWRCGSLHFTQKAILPARPAVLVYRSKVC